MTAISLDVFTLLHIAPNIRLERPLLRNSLDLL